MDLVRLFNKLLEIETTQQEILQRLEQIVGHTSPVAASSDEWLDSLEVQKLLKISDSTLYRLKKKKILTPARLGSRDYYLLSEVRNVINRFMK